MAFPVPLMAPLATIGYTAVRVFLVARRRSGRASGRARMLEEPSL
jgi:hypothetical protein